MIKFKIFISSLFIFLATHACALAQTELQTIKITDNIYILQGAGGNVGVMVGDDGVFMIDDKFAETNPAIMAAVSKLSDMPVKFLINTHWHGDHTGGNELMGAAGSIIVAHDNVRKTLSEKQFIEFFNRTTEPTAKVGLPVITFADAVTFHFNNDDIQVFHTTPAHTDGDAVVYFKNANVLHAGDVVFNGRYPIIDYGHGGSAEGYVAALDRLINFVNDDTKIIPGHGNLCDRKYLEDFRGMMSDVTKQVKMMKDNGTSLDEIMAAKPTLKYDERFAGSMKPDDFVGLVYNSLK